MDRSIPLFLIGLVFGGGFGFAIAAANGVTFDGHDHGDPAHHGNVDHSAAHANHDAIRSLEADMPSAPTLSVTAHKDPAAGWNLHIQTTNFRFSPENASSNHITGEGHAHVYVNGAKLGRFYGPWVHVPAFPAGQKIEVRVTLNANDHKLLAVGDAPLSQVLTLKD